MTDTTIRIAGGFNQDRSHMSPSIRAQIAELEARADEDERRRENEEAVWRAHNGVLDARERAARFQANSEDFAIRTAIAEGIPVHEALRGKGVGHTHREFVEIASARQDLEDAQRAARQRQTFNKWQAEQSEQSSGDMTVPDPEPPETAAARARVAERKAATKRTMQLARSAVRLYGADDLGTYDGRH